MKNIFRNSFLLLAAGCMAQCADDMDEIMQQDAELNADKVELSAVIDPMKDMQGNDDSRLMTGKGGKNYWTNDDQLLVFVKESGSMTPWEDAVYRFNKSAGSASNFYLDGSYTLDNGDVRNKLKLDVNKKYEWVAMYPFMKMEELGTPDNAYINYKTVQVQDCDKIMAHVNANSIMTAHFPNNDTTDEMNTVLDMKHCMTLLRFNVVNDEQKPVTLKSLTFQCDNADLSSLNETQKNFNLNMEYNHISSHYDARDFATVTLKNAKVVQPGESCAVYMIVPPFDVYGGKMTISISSDAGVFSETKNMGEDSGNRKLSFAKGCLNTATVHLKGSKPDKICTGFDPAFLEYLLDPKRGNLDVNGDGQLSKSELDRVTALFIYNEPLTSIKGIENFTELRELTVNMWDEETEEVLPGKLTEVDLSKNLKLEDIDFSAQPLTALNLENNKELLGIYVGGTKLSELNLMNQTKLDELEISYTNFSELPPMNATNLRYLYCTKCKFTELDLSKYGALEEVDCDSNQISRLVLPETIEYMDCSANKLKELDLSNLKSLYQASVNGNPGIRITLTEKQLAHHLVDYDSDATIIVKGTPNITFVDEEMKKAVIAAGADINKDGEISEFEAGNNLWDFTIEDGSKLTSLADLKKLKGVNDFTCINMQKVTDVDLTECPWLRAFSAFKCVALKTLKVGPSNGNGHFRLELEGNDGNVSNTALTEIDLSMKELNELKLKGFDNLKTVYVSQGTSEWIYSEVENYQQVVKFK